MESMRLEAEAEVSILIVYSREEGGVFPRCL